MQRLAHFVRSPPTVKKSQALARAREQERARVVALEQARALGLVHRRSEQARAHALVLAHLGALEQGHSLSLLHVGSREQARVAEQECAVGWSPE